MAAEHSVEVKFGFYAHDPANAYCTGESEPLTIAGQPAATARILRERT